MSTLKDALKAIAKQGSLDAEKLIQYANEDTIGGRDTGDWAPMSTFADEGRIIYALVRALRPETIVEIGVDSGGTSTHMLAALNKNRKGRLISFDIKPLEELGHGMTDTYRNSKRWELHAGVDALTVDLPDSADFIFEDGAHTKEFTGPMLDRLRLLKPQCLVSHDANTEFVLKDQGFHVWSPFSERFADAQKIVVDGAFAGLAVTFKS